MSDKVGRVSIVAALDGVPFIKSLNSLAGKAKATLGAVLSTAAIGAFSKKCLDLGSDLAEVQNVVDVTFRTMSDSVNQWAQSAAGTYGLSETMAKQYVGTFGSMAEAFGFTEKQALDMSETLTGLAGDVASFYNISQDEAYTKLKSVFSGETETLKDLGIIMTQSALDAYALANGFGKTTSAMTEMEKVSLRYAFVQDQLTNATGDFARTQGSWANQCRILSLQAQSAMAAVGQGLINLLTPAIKAINNVMGKVVQLANAFKGLTELIFGKSDSGDGTALSGAGAAASDLSNGLSDASNAAGGMDNATDDAASNLDGAAKSAKKLKRELMGFDQITKFSDTDDSTTSASPASSGGSGAGIDTSGVSALSSAIDDASEKTDGLIKQWERLAKLFKKGFTIGFGDSAKRIDEIKKHLAGIKESLRDIAKDSSVQAAAKRMFDSIALNAGKVVGSMASIGVSIADNLIGGFDGYLSKSKDYIKERLASIFNVSADIANLVGDAAVALADIATVFAGDNAKSITASIIGIFSDGFLGVIDLGLKFGRDILSVITGPFVDNAGLIRTTIDNTLAPIASILDTIHSGVKKTFGKLGTMYDEHVAPMFQSFRSGLSDVLKTLLDSYNQYVVPVLDQLADKFKTVWDGHIQPAIDQAIDFIGEFADVIKQMWETVVQPFLKYLAGKVGPIIGEIADVIGGVLLNAIAWLVDRIKDAFEFLTAVMDYLQGHQTVLKVVASLVTGIVTAFAAFKTITAVTGVIQSVTGAISGFTGALGMASSAFSCLKGLLIAHPFGMVVVAITAVIGIGVLLYKNWDKIKEKASALWKGIKEKFGAIKDTISNAVEGAKKAATEKFNKLKSKVSETVEGMKKAVADKFNAIKTKISESIEGAKKAVKDKFTAIKDNVSEKASAIKNKVGEKFGAVKDTMTSAMEATRKNVQTKLDNMKAAYEKNGGGIKGITAAAMQGVKDHFSSGYNVINKLTGGRLGDIVSSFKSKLGSAKSVASSIMTSIKNTFTNKINAARDAVRKAIDKIKGFFRFKWSLPHLKLPHPYIYGGFSLNPPQVPHIGVNWYKKAMDRPTILKKPTIFGQSGNNLLGAGEAGPEVVGGAKTLASMIQSAAKSGMAQMIQPPCLASVTPTGSARGQQELDRMLDSLQFADREDRIIELLLQIISLLETLDIVRLDAEALRKWFIKKTNANTQANGGKCELKV